MLTSVVFVVQGTDQPGTLFVLPQNERYFNHGSSDSVSNGRVHCTHYGPVAKRGGWGSDRPDYRIRKTKVEGGQKRKNRDTMLALSKPSTFKNWMNTPLKIPSIRRNKRWWPAMHWVNVFYWRTNAIHWVNVFYWRTNATACGHSQMHRFKQTLTLFATTDHICRCHTELSGMHFTAGCCLNIALPELFL